MQKTTYRRIDAVVKAFEILDFISKARGPVTGGDIARGTRMPKPTVMSHLSTMLDKNVIATEGDRYKLGMWFATAWSRTKASLEVERDVINEKLKEIGAE